MNKTQDSQEDFLRREKTVKEYFDKISAVLKEKVVKPVINIYLNGLRCNYLNKDATGTNLEKMNRFILCTCTSVVPLRFSA